ncbi:PREDICTED: serine protease 48 [Condylura cristata]|uniref:serine protease 48 n=1 Tax=Condylura cristata TaxID=143302 RepID=UPI0003345796|nr:PREDICTED: serine protease 48 [Condylura cristata]
MGPAGFAFLLFLLLGSCSCSPQKKDLQTVCGRPVYPSRVVGGQNSAEGRWPWQVSLCYSGTHVCGGSLISEQWVLTAAHCIQGNFFTFFYSVKLGQLEVNSLKEGKVYKVSKIITHPKFNETTADIALLKLSSRVTFTSLILPICLPNNTEQLVIPSSCWVTGWGKMNQADNDYATILQEAEVPIINQKACEDLYNPLASMLPQLEAIIHDDMICAGKNMKDSCKGDSGGPLSCHINGVWMQIGVVSWGMGCGVSTPGVYTNVTYYQKWINTTVSRAEALGVDHLDLTDFLFPVVLLCLALLGTF